MPCITNKCRTLLELLPATSKTSQFHDMGKTFLDCLCGQYGGIKCLLTKLGKGTLHSLHIGLLIGTFQFTINAWPLFLIGETKGRRNSRRGIRFLKHTNKNISNF